MSLMAITPTTPIMTRAQAADAGMLQYWTGRSCSKKHMAPRYTSSGACSHCVAGYRGRFATGAVRGSSRARNAGLTHKLSVMVHKDDAATVAELVEALNLARTMEYDAQVMGQIEQLTGSSK